MPVRVIVDLWTVHLSHEEMDLLIAGHAVEKMVPRTGEVRGTAIFLMDQEGKLHLTFMRTERD